MVLITIVVARHNCINFHLERIDLIIVRFTLLRFLYDCVLDKLARKVMWFSMLISTLLLFLFSSIVCYKFSFYLHRLVSFLIMITFVI